MIGAVVVVNDIPGAPVSGYVVQENGCWDWFGAPSSQGYGKVTIRGVRMYAHRFIFERDRGPIPEGLELDHLCRNRMCVRPDHLEPVSHRVNVARGTRKTGIVTCRRGHPYSGSNLRVLDVVRNGRKYTYRYCRACSGWRKGA